MTAFYFISTKLLKRTDSAKWSIKFISSYRFFNLGLFKKFKDSPVPPPLLPSSSVTNNCTVSNRNDPLSYLREDPKVLNRFSDQYIKRNKQTIQSFLSKFNSFRHHDSNSQNIVPELIGSYQYWTIPTPSGSAFCRLPVSSPWHPVEPFLNPEDFPNFEIKKLAISPSHSYFSFILEKIGDEHGKLYVKAFSDSKKILTIPCNRVFNVVFLTEACIAYTILNEKLRPDKVYLASINDFSLVTNDCIFSCNDGFLDISMTKDMKYLAINSNTLTSSEVHLLDVSRSSSPLILVQPRNDNVQYYVDHHENHFYILTNIGAKKNFKLVTAPNDNYSVSHWQDLYVPESDEKIEDIDLFESHLVIYLRKNAQCCIEILSLKTKKKSKVLLDIGVSISPASNKNFHAKYVRMNLRHPYSFDESVELHLDTLNFISLSSPSISKDVFCKSDFTVERIWVPSRDKHTRIPVTLLQKKDLSLSGTNPLLVEVYGAYGLPLDPVMKEKNLLLLTQGWIVAYVHVRGGSELGFQWHEDGKMLRKMNSINDLIDVCEFLISQKYTSPTKLTGSAVSAGALSLASAAFQQPGLFKGIVLKSPFVDLLSTMLDPTLPLTEQEYLEWGNPMRNPEVFQYMARYCPYDVLLRAPMSTFPSLFMTASKDDQRTPIWQCAKFMALYRHKSTKFSLFQCHDEGGHFLHDKTTEALEILFLNSCVQSAKIGV